MITVPATFRAMPRWWHDQRGREWLDALPVLVASHCRQWDLQVAGAFFPLVVSQATGGFRVAFAQVEEI